ncbi:UDP-2,4-diacetamido-2,4,6-trideoxy-beta-L-altropyranose hydrolase [Cytobacillus firmus]|uniref:UDP-2,4-diacetamido-2,4, 6-trideoxy-beta-L-altropyranose hydrolase n=1 Tax=Cytobacillus firmus TaxID=1399 RepID=UPI0021865FE8|nr:UDP-2,4-diacetamido-2,4,6-trideoxy-beta-L-altropyranose hydrolase [Cytobacillus firmus]URM33475.1 UDP-2,4-diacetamido-2,4,6-trideoxy-beta-L-altropyranose hydrolase [Cytobacillus firmus]
MLRIIFRADASIDIGTGHIMRCLTLAHYLKEQGARIAFICSETSGNLIEYIRTEGYEVYSIPESADFQEDANHTINQLKTQTADLIVVDHYYIDSRWEAMVRESFRDMKIMVIDDLANRTHDCDLLLDQNFFKEYKIRYDEWVPVNCRKLLGPEYLLLRPEFYQAQQSVSKRQPIKDILVFYGGSDPTNETTKALEALESIDIANRNIHVVVGVSNPHKQYIEAKCKEKKYFFYIQINYLAQLMKNADLSLGAGGVTMWERCFLGLPSIVTIVADNQRESTEAAEEFGAVWNLGWHEGVKAVNIADILVRAIDYSEELQNMSYKARQLMQSELKHKTHPVVEAILEVLQ